MVLLNNNKKNFYQKRPSDISLHVAEASNKIIERNNGERKGKKCINNQ